MTLAARSPRCTECPWLRIIPAGITCLDATRGEKPPCSSQPSVASSGGCCWSGRCSPSPSPACPDPPTPSPNVVISQVYGGGGNAGAPYTHDFVELFNRGTTTAVARTAGRSSTPARPAPATSAPTGQITELPGSLAPGSTSWSRRRPSAAVGAASDARPHRRDPDRDERRPPARSRSSTHDAARLQRRRDALLRRRSWPRSSTSSATAPPTSSKAPAAPAPSATRPRCFAAPAAAPTPTTTAPTSTGRARAPRNTATPASPCLGHRRRPARSRREPPATGNPHDVLGVAASTLVAPAGAGGCHSLRSSPPPTPVAAGGSTVLRRPGRRPAGRSARPPSHTFTVAANGDPAPGPDAMLRRCRERRRRHDGRRPRSRLIAHRRGGVAATAIHDIQGAGHLSPLQRPERRQRHRGRHRRRRQRLLPPGPAPGRRRGDLGGHLRLHLAPRPRWRSATRCVVSGTVAEFRPGGQRQRQPDHHRAQPARSSPCSPPAIPCRRRRGGRTGGRIPPPP